MDVAEEIVDESRNVNQSPTPSMISDINVPVDDNPRISVVEPDKEIFLESHLKLRGNSLTEEEFMERQRFIENSRTERHWSMAACVAPPMEDSAKCDTHDFIQEQRKIIEAFRSQPWPMQTKIQALKDYKENISRYVDHLNTIDMARDKFRRWFCRIKRKIGVFLLNFRLWRTVIKTIEVNFGTNVGSYFILLRWLCLLNLFLFVLQFGIVILPQILAGHGLKPSDEIKQNFSAISYIIDGRGYVFEYSVLFYGYYDSGQNETYEAPPPNPKPYIGAHYKLPIAYLLVTISVFVISGLATLWSMSSYTQSKILQHSGAGGNYFFAWKVFASWDFAVTSPRTVDLKMKEFIISFKESLYETTVMKQKEFKLKLKLWGTRIVTNIIVLVLLAGSGYAMYVTAENAIRVGEFTNIKFELQGSAGNIILNFIRTFQLQIVTIARNFLLPLIFWLLEWFEGLHPRNTLKLHLLRIFLVYFSSLYIIIISFFIISRSCVKMQGNINCRCWETSLGQELFKLMVSLTLAEMFSIIALPGSRWLLSKCSKLFNKWIGPAEFDPPASVLNLIYGQGLILFGVLFCPFLPGMGFLRNIIIFYLKAFAVFFFNRPQKILFRLESTHSFYMAILLVTVFISFFPIGYAIAEIKPSNGCGPFRGLANMLQAISVEVTTWPSFLAASWNYLQRATVIIPLIIILCIIIYYYITFTKSLKGANKDLVVQLKVEQKRIRIQHGQENSMDFSPFGPRRARLRSSISSPMLISPKELGLHSICSTTSGGNFATTNINRQNSSAPQPGDDFNHGAAGRSQVTDLTSSSAPPPVPLS